MKTLMTLLAMISMALLSPLSSAAQKNLPSCISKQYGNVAIPANRVVLNAPQIAENGSVIGVNILKVNGLETGTHVQEVSLYNEFREEPIATFFLTEKMRSENIKTRIRLRESSNVYAVAKLNNGQVVGGQSFIKVTIGGCGGGGDLTAAGSKAQRVCQNQ